MQLELFDVNSVRAGVAGRHDLALALGTAGKTEQLSHA